jgi:hypothetical protein
MEGMMRRQDADWEWPAQAAAFISEDSGALNVRVRTATGIWRPARCWLEEGGEGPDICYELPPELADYPQRVYEWGWDYVGDTDGLLDGFVRLDSPESALRFAQRWGPLWLCGVHGQSLRPYHSLTREELFTQADPNDEHACYWHPREPVAGWLHYARRMAAVMEALALVRQDPPQPVPRRLWSALDVNAWFIDHAKGIPDRARFAEGMVHVAIETAIGAQLAARLRLGWGFRLELDAGFGFLPATWLLLAQLACRVRAIYVCSNCGHVYARAARLRAPKPGQQNFCDDCRQGDKNTASKKLSARRRRARG